MYQEMGKTAYLESDLTVYYSTILPSISNVRVGREIFLGGSHIDGVDFRGYAFWRLQIDLPRWPNVTLVNHHFMYSLLHVHLPGFPIFLPFSSFISPHSHKAKNEGEQTYKLWYRRTEITPKSTVDVGHTGESLV